MARIQTHLKRSSLLMIALSMFAAWVVTDTMLFMRTASASQITNRSLQISSATAGTNAVGNPGEGGNGQKARYTFTFTLPTSGNVGSVLFQVCTTPLPGTTCTTPTGFTAANVASLTSTALSAFSVNTSTTLTGSPYNCDNTSGPAAGRRNCIAISDSTPAGVTGAVTVAFGGQASDYITNPSTENEEFFVRMTTYSDAAFTTVVDQGTVANAITQQIDITAKVQETLNFSVASSHNAPNATCDALSGGGALSLGDGDGVLSFQQSYDAHSYFRVSTNANNGTLVYYSGDTLEYESNDIAAIGLGSTGAGGGTASATGTEQFGLALDLGNANTSFNQLAANDGTNISGHLYDYGDGSGTIASGGTAKFHYDTASVATPRPIAVADDPITCDTGSVRYLGNISTTTPPGIYTTTITYLALPTY